MSDESPAQPTQRARERIDEIRMYAELGAIYEATHKFDADILPLSGNDARDFQQAVAKLARQKVENSSLIQPQATADALGLLKRAIELGTNDYHLARKPGEVILLRSLQGPEVDQFYDRMEAHLKAGIEGLREDEEQALAWKDDPDTRAYLKALADPVDPMATRYARPIVQQHPVAILSTWTADEISISYLVESIMQRNISDVVDPSNIPEDGMDESQLAWFFRLFSLRAAPLDPDTKQRTEHMLFFTFLQKTDDDFEF